MASEPTKSRPGFGQSYGISTDAEGMLPWSWATERLAQARNYWIGTTGRDGRPSVTPVWGAWLDGAFRFGSSAASRKAQNLARDPRVVVHLESGDEVVILEGTAERAAPDTSVADEFEHKYGYRPNVDDTEGEAWFRLRPARAFAWLERDYPRTATRFTFDVAG